jgi:hypothetical protein
MKKDDLICLKGPVLGSQYHGEIDYDIVINHGI